MARRRNPDNPLVKPAFLRIALLLKESREAAGLSQRECAALLGVSTSTLATYELGTRSIPQERLEAAASVLGNRGLADVGGPRRPMKRTEAVRPEITEFFDSPEFGLWWADKSKVLIQELGLSGRDLAAAQSVLIRCVTSAAQTLRDRGGSTANRALIARCDNFFPAVLNSFRNPDGAVGSAA